MTGPSFGRTGSSPAQPWYEKWLATRRLLAGANAVSRAKASGSSAVDDRLRELAADPLVTELASARGAADRGETIFANLATTLATLVPPLPIPSDHERALVQLWWWGYSALGLSRTQLLDVSRDPAVVEVVAGQQLTVARIDSRMWRTGTVAPVHGDAPEGLRALADAVEHALSKPAALALDDVWVDLAVARLRLLNSAALALLAMLAHMGDQPLHLSRLERESVRLQPTALAAAFATLTGIRAAAATLRTLDLAGGTIDQFALLPGVAASARAALSEVERRFGAFSAIAAIEHLFPPEPFRPSTWPAAAEVRSHALGAARESEALDVGESWRARVLERLCIFEREHGRLASAIDAGALRAAERARVDDELLADILVNYGDALGHARRFAEAEEQFRRALELERSPLEVAKTLNIYATVLRLARRREEAVELQRQAVQHLDDLDESQTLAEVLHDMSLTLTALRRYRDAYEVLESAADHAPPDSEVALLVRIRLAATLNELRRHAEARATAEGVLARVEAMYGKRSWPYVNTLHARGIALDALAAASADADLKKYAEREYHDYRLIREQLEARPDDAPALADDI